MAWDTHPQISTNYPTSHRYNRIRLQSLSNTHPEAKENPAETADRSSAIDAATPEFICRTVSVYSHHSESDVVFPGYSCQRRTVVPARFDVIYPFEGKRVLIRGPIAQKDQLVELS